MNKILYFLLLFSSMLSAQKVIYVKNGTNGDGTSWANATGNLRIAMENAVAGDEIWVATGFYTPTACTVCSEADRSLSFVLKDGVSILGGFDGTETTKITTEIIESKKSVLSGDINIDGKLDANSYNIMRINGYKFRAAPSIINFVFKAGNANNPTVAIGEPKNSGAAIYINGSLQGSVCGPNIQFCNFENNFALGEGGALYIYGGFNGTTNARIERCNFKYNKSNVGGGSISINVNFGGKDLTFINNSTVRFSESGDGGGIKMSSAENGLLKTRIIDSYIDFNTAKGYGGAVCYFSKKGISETIMQNTSIHLNTSTLGGGIYADFSDTGKSTNMYRNNYFSNNASSSEGGGMYILASDKGVATETYDGIVFGENTAKLAGGGIFNNGTNGICNPLIVNSMFVSNVTDTYGGGIYNLGKKGDASPTIINSIFTKNSAFSAGGLYCLGSEFGKSNANIINSNFVQNIANTGGGLYFNAGDFSGNASGSIINSIIYFNSAVEAPNIRSILSSPKISYSIVQTADCNTIQSGMGSNITCGTGMIYNKNPMFLDTAKFDYHLLKSSVAIDKGFTDSITNRAIANDYYASPRKIGSKVDIGAAENQDNVAVYDIEGSENLQMYPNPTSKYVYITSKNDITKSKNIEIFNLNGQLIKNLPNFGNNIYDVGDLESGIYIIKINNGVVFITSKLIKL